MRQLLYVVSVVGFCAAACYPQSLGDLARAERLRRASTPSARRVITNDDIATAPATKPPSTDSSDESHGPPQERPEPSPKAAEKQKRPEAKEVQQTIRIQKQKVLALEAHAKEVQARLDARESVGAPVAARVVQLNGPPGPCDISDAAWLHPYEDWCKEPERLRADLKKTQAELAEERSKLEVMQEEARKAGFGSVIYDPD